MPPAAATDRSARHQSPRAARPRLKSQADGAPSRDLPSSAHGSSVAKLVPFASIGRPGAYVSMWDGLLVRIPRRAIRSGGAPVLDIVGAEPLLVTKISDDPFVPVTKARLLASNLDVAVRF